MSEHHSGRRRFIGTSMLAAALLKGGIAWAVAGKAAGREPKFKKRIDVHAHYVPDAYRRATVMAGHAKPDGMPGLPLWSRDAALSTMDRVGIASAMLSISSPGVHFGDDAAARDLARAVNEEGAEAVRDHPARFGLFASLPLPDVDGALREIEYAFDVLHADGVVLMTNYHGIYLGDARFDPVFAELNRRKALVFLHPTSPYCPGCLDDLPYPKPFVDFMFDTTRAVTHLIYSGTLARNRDLQVIVPHAGAAIPALSDRIAAMAAMRGSAAGMRPEEVLASMRRLHYDLAGNAVPKMINSLLSVTDTTHLLYGSDWPFTPEPLVIRLAEQMLDSGLFDARVLAALAHDNALQLLPRLRQLQQAG